MNATTTNVVKVEPITITVLYPGALNDSLLRACPCECACDGACGCDSGYYACGSDCYMCD